MENIANPALDPFLSLPRRLALRLMRYLTKDDRTRLVFVDERDGLRSFHDDGAGDLTKCREPCRSQVQSREVRSSTSSENPYRTWYPSERSASLFGTICNMDLLLLRSVPFPCRCDGWHVQHNARSPRARPFGVCADAPAEVFAALHHPFEGAIDCAQAARQDSGTVPHDPASSADVRVLHALKHAHVHSMPCSPLLSQVTP